MPAVETGEISAILSAAHEVEHLVGLVDLDVVGRLGVAGAAGSAGSRASSRTRRRSRRFARGPAPSGRRRRSAMKSSLKVGEQRRDRVVECGQPPCDLRHRRARHADREVRRAERRRELAADLLPALRRDGRQAHADRAGLAACRARLSLRRRSCGRSRPHRCGSPGRAPGPPARARALRRGCSGAPATPLPTSVAVRRGRIRTVTSGERAVSQRDLERARAARRAPGSRKLPSPRTRVETTSVAPAVEMHARVGRAAGSCRPAKSILCRYVVAFGAFRVSVGPAAAALPGNASSATSKGERGARARHYRAGGQVTETTARSS